MDAINDFFTAFSSFLWGWPMIILLLGTHIFLTIRLRFPQRKIFKAIKLSVKKDKDATGDVSQFSALATALAATIGTGNIIGVATAIALGGPGAVLWCWLTGVFGISTKYAEGLLAVKYRVKTRRGRMLGGPMYALEKGLGWKWLAILFAIFSIFIHKASILYVCFLFVYLYDRKKGLTLIGCFAGMAVATLAGVLVQKLFLSSSMSFFDNGSYAYYATNSIGSSFFDSFWKIVFGQILLLAMLVFFNKPITSFIKSLPSEDADKARFLKFIVLFDLATIPVTFVLGIWRGYEYLYIFRLLMWGIVVSAISVGLNRQSKWAINVITLLLFAFWIGNRWFATYADSALMPYVFQLFAR